MFSKIRAFFKAKQKDKVLSSEDRASLLIPAIKQMIQKKYPNYQIQCSRYFYHSGPACTTLFTVSKRMEVAFFEIPPEIFELPYEIAIKQVKEEIDRTKYVGIQTESKKEEK